jgi:BASS family bile acid:Na+ symporter
MLTFYTKYFAVWVVLGGIVAYCWPGYLISFKGGMNWFFALTMFGIGAVLRVDDFKNIAEKPLIVVLGVVCQFVVMPGGAFVLAKVFNLPAKLAVGLILTAAAPGAMASNVICYIARADTAYSVSLTTVSTLLCPVLTPGLTLLLAGAYLEIPFWPMFISVVTTVIVPLLCGLAMRHYFSRPMEKITKIFPAISVTFIIFICSMVIALNRQQLNMLTGVVFLAVLILNIYGMLMGYGVGALFRLGWRRRRTLCIEIGMQNAGLGTVLALKHFDNEVAIPAAVFVFTCIVTASVLVELWKERTD